MFPAAALTSLSAGLVFGLSLIVAIGPQNAYVLRQGALRQHVPTVVGICSASDVVLIMVGIAGAGAALTTRRSLLEAVRVAGAVVLVVYSALAARRALTPPGHDGVSAMTRPGHDGVSAMTRPGYEGVSAMTPLGHNGVSAMTPPGHDGSFTPTRSRPCAPPPPPPAPRANVIAVCLAFTWLNPAVYLDTVVLLGSVANARPGHQWWFGAGAAIASVLWFAAIGFGARLLGPVLRHPQAWRVLEAGVAVVMVVTALRVLSLA